MLTFYVYEPEIEHNYMKYSATTLKFDILSLKLFAVNYVYHTEDENLGNSFTKQTDSCHLMKSLIRSSRRN